ncbi:MAG TPA: hypothetical protein VFS20_31800 [Longimicrobium sp.]|nr:hypothetical protein [Longimicrobium sp.]
MKKLKLNFDDIQVNSFDVAGAKGRAGTVHAHTYTYQSGVECEPTGIQYTCYSHDGPHRCDVQPISAYC